MCICTKRVFFIIWNVKNKNMHSTFLKLFKKVMAQNQRICHLDLPHTSSRRRQNWLTMQTQHFYLLIYFLTLCTSGKITKRILLPFVPGLMHSARKFYKKKKAIKSILRVFPLLLILKLMGKRFFLFERLICHNLDKNMDIGGLWRHEHKILAPNDTHSSTHLHTHCKLRNTLHVNLKYTNLILR